MLLHPAGTFTPAQGANTLFACERNATCLGDNPRGINVPLSPALANGETTWSDVTVKFELFKPVAEGGLGCTIEGERRLCPAADGGEPIDVTSAYGQWTLTMIDLGQKTAGAQVENCAECSNGGGHSNQWVLQIRDNDPSAVQPTLPNETEPNGAVAQANALGALPAGMAATLTENDLDYFTFELPSAARVEISTGLRVEPDPSEQQDPDQEEEEEGPDRIDTKLAVYQADGTTLIGEEADDEGDNAPNEVIERSLQAGRYVVRVRGYGDDDLKSDITGEYAVRVRVLGAAAAGN
jgi:hypothetical protein